jgi:hypothetical protein
MAEEKSKGQKLIEDKITSLLERAKKGEYSRGTKEVKPEDSMDCFDLVRDLHSLKNTLDLYIEKKEAQLYLTKIKDYTGDSEGVFIVSDTPEPEKLKELLQEDEEWATWPIELNKGYSTIEPYDGNKYLMDEISRDPSKGDDGWELITIKVEHSS